jgi:N-dimethylarginine dimethylaminohydrolase
VFELLDRHDFVLDPLPNLMFTRDASFWVGNQVAVASLASDRRRRETDLASVVYRHHPMFAGTKWLYGSDLEHIDGGDVLLLAPGVVAIGVGQRTAPAGAERLARCLFERGLAHSVLAVPMNQANGAGHLDTVCAILDSDAVVMHPAIAYALTAHTIQPRGDGMRMSRAQPFLEAAAQAMSIARLRVIDSGTDPLWGQPGQRDDGSNVLAVGDRLVISHERNSETNARLEAAGVRVIRVPSSELGSVRGGPRCMTCPVSRDPAVVAPDVVAESSARASAWRPRATELADVVPESRPASQPDVAELPPVPVSAAAAGDAAGERDSAELASARLQATTRPVAGPAAEPECAEPEENDGYDQRDHGQPDERLGNRQSHQHNHDRGNYHRQHSKHDSTLRLAARRSRRGSRASRNNGRNRLLRAAYPC